MTALSSQTRCQLLALRNNVSSTGVAPVSRDAAKSIIRMTRPFGRVSQKVNPFGSDLPPTIGAQRRVCCLLLPGQTGRRTRRTERRSSSSSVDSALRSSTKKFHLDAAVAIEPATWARTIRQSSRRPKTAVAIELPSEEDCRFDFQTRLRGVPSDPHERGIGLSRVCAIRSALRRGAGEWTFGDAVCAILAD